MTLSNNRLRISAEILVLYPSLRSKRFPRAFPRFKAFFAFERAKIGASAKKCEKGEGKGGKETLARNPHDFEKPVRPRTEFPDWRGMVVLITK